MNTLCKAAKHMLEVADVNQYAVAAQAPHSDVMAYNAAVNNLRTALEQEEEASAWLAERKEHWRKKREKAQATKDQDPELSAALGWPGGISDPVLDRTRLLQMVAALRLASKQALEALLNSRPLATEDDFAIKVRKHSEAITALRAALAQQAEPVEPVEPVAWECRAGGLKPLTQRQYDAQTVATKRHYTRIAPPQRKLVPLTEEEILAAVGWERAAMYMKLAPNFPVDEAKKETLTNARAVEKAVWEKNNGQA